MQDCKETERHEASEERVRHARLKRNSETCEVAKKQSDTQNYKERVRHGRLQRKSEIREIMKKE